MRMNAAGAGKLRAGAGGMPYFHKHQAIWYWMPCCVAHSESS
jgi:hypothetical protein